MTLWKILKYVEVAEESLDVQEEVVPWHSRGELHSFSTSMVKNNIILNQRVKSVW